jgi:hypothetical protein
MTMIQLDDGSIFLHSPTQYSEALRAEIEKLGPIRHLIAPNSAHWTYIKIWKAYVPDALAWSAPGLRRRRQVKRERIAWHGDLGPASQPHFAPEIEQVAVPGIGGFCEVCFFHRRSQTLVVTDLIQNLDGRDQSGLMRMFSAVIDAKEKAPIYLRAVVRLKGKPARDAARQLVALEPKTVIFSHGKWFDMDAAARLRRSLDWLA